MSDPSVCANCRAPGPTQFVMFREFYGLLVIVKPRLFAGNYCAACARKLYWRTMAVNLTLGMLSVMSIVLVPMAVMINTLAFLRVRERFAGRAGAGAAGPFVMQLPWSPAIGEIESSLAREPLTASSAAFGLSLFAGLIWFVVLVLILLFTMIGPLGPDSRSEQQDAYAMANLRQSRNVALAATPFIFVAIAGSYAWRKRSRCRPGDAPDMLVELFPAPVILQIERAQFAVVGSQCGREYRIAVVVQNLFQTPSTLRLDFAGPLPMPVMELALPPVGVGMGVIRCPLPGMAESAVADWSFQATSAGSAGPRARSVQRTAMTTKARDNAFALTAAVAGHGHLRGAGPPPMPGPNFFDRFGTARALLLPQGTPVTAAKPCSSATAVYSSTDRRATPDAIAKELLTLLGIS